MAETFHEKVVIITGASSGIGEALAYQLAGQGAWLALAARRVESLEAVAAECERRGGKALVVPTDVGAEDSCQNLIELTVGAYGRIDALINNAAIGMWARFDETESLHHYEEIMRVNYLGAVYCTAYALPYLKQSQGRIVGVASLTARTGVPTRSAYGASKHAMAGFFDTLRIELSDEGVSVTMIYPGFVSSGFHVRGVVDGQGVLLGENHTVDYQKAMTSERCAEIIVQTMAKRKRQVVMGFRGKLGQWIKLIAPGLVDNIAKKAISSGR